MINTGNNKEVNSNNHSHISVIESVRVFLRGRFDLDEDNAPQYEVENRIESGVVIRGINLWVLIFATIIASIGLNMNSLAVIIGAMLISPLMGPIMGMGFSLGIRDFALLKRSLKNFGFMVLISILTSTLYFTVSPLTIVQSEMLSRTQPTTWDVFIAFVGGLAGIIAQTRKDRTTGTVIQGVAIATALMPPLCTAGYGLAMGNIQYFAGAFYLFVINTVFISMASFVMVGFLKYKRKAILDPAREKRVNTTIGLIIVLTVVPSVFIGYNLVRTSMFEYDVKKFVAESFAFDDTRVVDYVCDYSTTHKDSSRVEVVLWGEPISDDAISAITLQMANYGIKNCKLFVKQSSNTNDLTSSFIQTNFETLIQEKNSEISLLNDELSQLKSKVIPNEDIARELVALVGGTTEASISQSTLFNQDDLEEKEVVLCYIKSTVNLSDEQIDRLKAWLEARTGTSTLKLIME